MKNEKAKKVAKDIVETLQYGEEEAKKRKMVRKRESYAYFSKVYKNFPKGISKNNKALLMVMIWKILDDYKGFHYEKNSVWALESITQILADKNMFIKNEN